MLSMFDIKFVIASIYSIGVHSYDHNLYSALPDTIIVNSAYEFTFIKNIDCSCEILKNLCFGYLI